MANSTENKLFALLAKNGFVVNEWGSRMDRGNFGVAVDDIEILVWCFDGKPGYGLVSWKAVLPSNLNDEKFMVVLNALTDGASRS